MSGPVSPLHLSVVVPTYNHAPLLRLAIERLAAQTLPPETFEVIVVDDGSTDETPAILTVAPAPVRAVRLDHNHGRSAARNAGIRAARAPLVVFIDSDVLVHSDFLQRHLELHQAAGRPVVGRGPVATIPAPDRMTARAPRYAFSGAYLTTANASVPRRDLIEVGLFDEGFRAYGWEDFDLGLRLQGRGLPRVFSRAAVAFHVQPPSTYEAFDRELAREEERAEMALYLLQKHPGFATRVLISDTPLHRALTFLLGGAGLLTPRNAPPLARWLDARGHRTLAFLVARGVLNRHYLCAFDHSRALPEARSP